MPLYRFLFLAPLALAWTIAPATTFAAGGKVQLEIVGQSQTGTAMALQDWLKALRTAGIQNVRLRTAEDADAPRIDVRGTEESPVYVVTGVLTGDEVVVPGARFRRTEAKRLAAWLADLAERGPPDRREPAGPLGLSAKQFHVVHDDLARPLGFSTRGITRAEAVRKIGSQLHLPLRIEGSLADGDDKIEEELSDLSCGTALACILRPIGFSMVPQSGGGAVTYAVAKSRLDREVWPIGWPPEKPQAEVIPALFKFRNVNVQNVSASQVMEAIGRQIKVPILLDRNAMARHGIDPAKASVSLPQQRTNYSLALRKLLFQARLKFEIRVDEAGTPFLWVSTVKPV